MVEIIALTLSNPRRMLPTPVRSSNVRYRTGSRRRASAGIYYTVVQNVSIECGQAEAQLQTKPVDDRRLILSIAVSEIVSAFGGKFQSFFF